MSPYAWLTYRRLSTSHVQAQTHTPIHRLAHTNKVYKCADRDRNVVVYGQYQGERPPTPVQRRETGYDAPPALSTPPPRLPPNSPPPPPDDDGGWSNATKAFVAGAFILGMGAGIWFDTQVTFEPQNVASTVLLDTKTPNSEVCMANGYSSMVFDQRVFVSFNPFNVYVSQPEVKPGCVLRRANVNVLESRGLVDSEQVSSCKRNMNTFAFVGDLNKSPEVSCVYHSEEAENQYLKDPSKAIMGDGYQSRQAAPAATDD